MNRDHWNKIYSLTKAFSEFFPDGIIFIDGIAAYLHTQDKLTDFIEYSHDSAFCLSIMDLSDMRDLEEIIHTINV